MSCHLYFADWEAVRQELQQKVRRLHLRRPYGQSVDAERAFRFVPACAARLQFAAHPFPRSAPLLRQPIAERGRTDETDSRVAGTQ